MWCERQGAVSERLYSRPVRDLEQDASLLQVPRSVLVLAEHGIRDRMVSFHLCRVAVQGMD